MALAFNPTIRARTVLPILTDGSSSFRFTASFHHHEQYVQSRREGTRVEMWTNLPVDGTNGEWHALPFAYAEDAAPTPEDNTVSLLSPTPAASKGQQATLTLDVSLTNLHPGSAYSFTYRVVRPWGAVTWLGAYRQNGDIIFEEKDVRFTLSEGCKIENNVIVSPASEASSVVVATLNNAIGWACWGFSGNECTGPSADLSMSPASAALLTPRKRHVDHIDVKPLIIKAKNGAISITPDGHIVLHNDTSLAIHSLDEHQPFSAFVEQELPRFSVIGENGGFALIAPKDKSGLELPVKLSAIPTHREAWNGPHTDVKLDSNVVRSMLGEFRGKEAVLVSTPLKVFTTLSCQVEENAFIRVAPPGAQIILAPLHDLVTSEADGPISLALLSSSVSASIEMIESLTPLVLLTPPPSPPPSGRFPLKTSSADAPTRPISLPSAPAPEDETVSEAVAYTPLTPTSPPHREETEFFTKEDTANVALVPHNGINLVHGSSLRFMVVFMSWLLQASFSKICALFGGNLLLWLVYKLFGMESDASRVSSTLPAATAPAVPDVAVEDHADAGDEKVSDAETLLGDGAADGAKQVDIDPTPGLDEGEDEDGTLIDDIPVPRGRPTTKDPQSKETLSAARPPISIQPRAHRKEKSRFVADVRSDTVTLLVRSQSGGSNVPELKFIANGDQVSISGHFNRVVQLAPDTQLIELRLPSARLEVSLA